MILQVIVKSASDITGTLKIPGCIEKTRTHEAHHARKHNTLIYIYFLGRGEQIKTNCYKCNYFYSIKIF